MNLDAKPFALELRLKKAALIMIDLQRDFVEPGGFGETLGNRAEPLQQILPACAQVLTAWRQCGLTVVHTRESHLPDLSDCPPAKRQRGAPRLRIGDPGPMGRILIRGEPGNDIVEAVAPIQGEHVVDKPGKGAFYGTGLHEWLQEHAISQLIFTGVTTEVCVQTSMREANDRGYECVLVEDCTASYFPYFKQATLDMITAQGAIVGWTCHSRQLIQMLSSHPLD